MLQSIHHLREGLSDRISIPNSEDLQTSCHTISDDGIAGWIHGRQLQQRVLGGKVDDPAPRGSADLIVEDVSDVARAGDKRRVADVPDEALNHLTTLARWLGQEPVKGGSEVRPCVLRARGLGLAQASERGMDAEVPILAEPLQLASRNVIDQFN